MNDALCLPLRVCVGGGRGSKYNADFEDTF